MRYSKHEIQKLTQKKWSQITNEYPHGSTIVQIQNISCVSSIYCYRNSSHDSEWSLGRSRKTYLPSHSLTWVSCYRMMIHSLTKILLFQCLWIVLDLQNVIFDTCSFTKKRVPMLQLLEFLHTWSNCSKSCEN